MSSLQEMLQQITERDKALGQSLRALLEAVGEMHAKDMAMIESLRQHVANWEANAALGKMVRGMPDGTALQRTGRQYYAMRCHPKVGWRAIAASGATNPAEALRAIQEVGDAKA